MPDQMYAVALFVVGGEMDGVTVIVFVRSENADLASIAAVRESEIEDAELLEPLCATPTPQGFSIP